MSIIEALRTYLATYSGLKTGAPLWVDSIGPEPNQYAIIPLAGEKIIEKYLDDGSLREYPFAFQSLVNTTDDPERLETNGFFETLSEWFEAQTAANILPDLASNKKAISIEALGWGYLFEQGNSDTGIYQIQCKLTYEQHP